MRAPLSLLLAAAVSSLLVASPASAARRRAPPPPVTHEAMGRLTWASPQSNAVAVSPDGLWVAVAATTSNQVQVFSALTLASLAKVVVGIEPVSLAFKPDGSELWVSNHVSDAVSVIDMLPTNASYLRVVETIQEADADGATLFDEPVGIAFKEDGSQAYVALSSRNEIAVVDTSTYAVLGRVLVRAQEPRALAVSGNKLFVAAFESGNRTELSLCANLIGNGVVGDQCSLGLVELFTFVTDPNIPGATKNIVVDNQIPDRDLFVYDTANVLAGDVDRVSGVGTLLYGLASDGNGNVFITNTQARNQANGNHGLVLADLQNHIFDNRVSRVNCGGASCTGLTTLPLDPALPASPTPMPPSHATSLATPFGVAATDYNDVDLTDVLVVTAAASSRIATLSPTSGTVLARLDVGAIPRGVALRNNGDGTHTAYVLNSVDSTLTAVTVGTPGTGGGALAAGSPVAVGNDPTPAAVRQGRIAFNSAFASTSGTFACASCHPDGNTDQLLWRIGGACSADIGCDPNEDEPRLTMPIRGLRDAVPLHWDGSLGDPFGAGNGSVGFGGSVAPSCVLGDADGDDDCFLDLVEGSLAGVMCDQTGSCPAGGNELTAQERQDMAAFLESVSYPPARSRTRGDVLSASAKQGFKDFFMDQGGVADPNTCADSNSGCHELPLGTSTNSETLNGFDAPTTRGLTDRFMQFSMAPTGVREILVLANAGFNGTPFGFPQFTSSPLEPSIAWDPNIGYREETTFGSAFLAFEGVYGDNTPLPGLRPLDIFEMFEETSTGHSGALGRQVTLNTLSAAGCPACDVEDILADAETADQRGLVNLRGNGMRNGGGVTISYEPTSDPLLPYKVNSVRLTRASLISEAQTGILLATLTAHLRSGVTEGTAQPLVAPVGAQCSTGNGGTGNPALPSHNGGTTYNIETAHVASGDAVFVNGQPATATLNVTAGGSTCDQVTPDTAQIVLTSALGTGMHTLQVRSAAGLISNEMPICAGSNPGANCNN